MNHYLPFLRTLAFFHGLPDAAILALTHRLGRARVAAGDVLFSAGEPAGPAWVVVRGSLQVMSPGGRRVSVARPGEALGLSGLFLDDPRDVTAVAAEETWLFRIDREVLETSVAAADTLGALFCERVARLLAAQLRHVDEVLILAETEQRARLTPLFVPVAEPIPARSSSVPGANRSSSFEPRPSSSTTGAKERQRREVTDEDLARWIGEAEAKSGMSELGRVKVVYSDDQPLRSSNPLLGGRR